MKLFDSKHKNSKIPTIVANTSGELIYMNDKAFAALPSVKVGDRVSKIIDMDSLKKISMYDDKTEVVNTKIKPYGKAVVKVVGKGVFKSIEIFLENDKNINKMFGDKNALYTFSEAINDNSGENVKILDFINTISDRISYKKGYSYRKLNATFTSNDEFYTTKSRLELILVSVAFILNEINYVDPIDVYARKEKEFLYISLSVPTDEFGDADFDIAEERVCALFPQIVTRTSFVDSICEECGIERGMSYNNKHVIVNLRVRELQRKGDYSLRSGAYAPSSASDDKIDKFIEIFGFNSK